MELEKTLRNSRSKRTIEEVIAYVREEPRRIRVLMDCFFSEDERLSRHAAWAAGNLGFKNPEMFEPYFGRMLDLLEMPVHNGIKRSIVRILQNASIPETLAGRTADICFMLLNNKDEAIAVQVFSMTVLANICKSYTELAPELRTSIEQQLSFQSAGFRSRASRVLKQLDRY